MKKVDGYELKSCPFCGSKDVGFRPCILRYASGWFVECENVDCYTTGPLDLGKSGAAEKWNTREEATE